jgi:hypothetical protein
MDPAIRLALFDLLVELGKSRPFRSTSLSERLGLNFKTSRLPKNPYFHFYQSHGTVRPPLDGAIVGVELREPVDAPGQGSVNGLLILEISHKLGVSQEDVGKRFGPEYELVVPSPHAPSTEPIYWTYSQEGYKLSFGFSRSEPAALISVTLDAIRRREPL